MCVQRQLSAVRESRRSRWVGRAGALSNRSRGCSYRVDGPSALEPSVVGSFAAVAGQGKLPGTYFSVVLCELDKGFKGLWIPHQHRSIRQAVSSARGWCRWSKWPSAEGP